MNYAQGEGLGSENVICGTGWDDRGGWGSCFFRARRDRKRRGDGGKRKLGFRLEHVEFVLGCPEVLVDAKTAGECLDRQSFYGCELFIEIVRDQDLCRLGELEKGHQVMRGLRDKTGRRWWAVMVACFSFSRCAWKSQVARIDSDRDRHGVGSMSSAKALQSKLNVPGDHQGIRGVFQAGDKNLIVCSEEDASF